MATSSSPHSKDPTSFSTSGRISSGTFWICTTFWGSDNSNLFVDEISANIRDEMRRLHGGRNVLGNNANPVHYSQPLALNLANAYFGLSPE